MKKLSVILLCFLASILLKAQSPIFLEGDKVLNLTLGLGSSYYSGSGYSTTFPAVAIAGEYGIAEGIADIGSVGVGGFLGYSANKYEYLGWGYKYTNVVIGARGVFHYPFLENFDTYAGLMLGYRIVQVKEFGINTNIFGSVGAKSSGMAGSLFVGGRYYFTDNLAALLELGYGIAYLNLGISLKF